MPPLDAAAPWPLIANPAAGGGRGLTAARRAAERLAQAGRRVELMPTQGPGHGAELAHRAVAAGAGFVVACGGDGTVAELLPALAGQPVALGLLPFGTANDFARALGVPRRLDPAVRLLLSGQAQPVDLGAAGGRLFCSVATFGFDAEVNHRVRSGPGASRRAAGYVVAALRHLPSFRPPVVRLAGEFGRLAGAFFLIATGNTPSYGGGLRIVPPADPRDGRFDVCLVGPVSAWTVLRLLPRLRRGRHLGHPAVEVRRTAWLEIDTDEPHLLYADGEPLGRSPIRLETRSAALRVVLPARV